MKNLYLFLFIITSLSLNAQNFIVQPASFIDCSQGGLSWGDYDNDGDLDVIITGVHENGTSADLYRNKDGNFTKQTTSFAGLSLGSANWGDYDNDGDLDLLLCGANSIGEGSTILYRNDNNLFVETGVYLTGIALGEASWFDYNNDGFLDILISGDTLYNNPVTKLYKNNGNGTFTNVPQDFKACLNSFVAFGDYDNDGDQDILLSGVWDTSYITRIYRNDGGTFHETGISLLGVAYSDGIFADIDNDGDNDIVYMGSTLMSDYRVKIYFNDGNGNFFPSSDSLEGEWVGRIDAADINNDGFPDLGITGALCCGDALSRIYINDGTGHFNLAPVSLPDLYFSQINFGDYDNDGDADFLLFGIPPDGPGTTMTRLYRNTGLSNSYTVNEPPSVPASLTASVDDHTVTFSWLPSNDNTTPEPALTYSLMAGNTSEPVKLINSMSDPENGFHRIYSPGNVSHNTSWKLKNVSGGSYVCKVQALDQTGRPSEFSGEVAFSVILSDVPEIKEADLKLSPVPVEDHLKLETTGLFSDGSYTIMGISGNEIMKGIITDRNLILNLASFPRGIYQVVIRKGNVMTMGRFVKL